MMRTAILQEGGGQNDNDDEKESRGEEANTDSTVSDGALGMRAIPKNSSDSEWWECN